MVRIPGKSAFLPIAIAAVLGLSPPVAAIELPSGLPSGLSACLVGLGSGDGSPVWSLLDVTPSRSIDLDLADGVGMTVACGTFAAPKRSPATTITPAGAVDPSLKGDFGSL